MDADPGKAKRKLTVMNVGTVFCWHLSLYAEKVKLLYSEWCFLQQ
jgi:hypothetical protein